LHIAPHLGIANFSASSGWIADLRGDNIDYRTLSGESRIIDPETVEDWKNY
jgi:hypothetical protein